MPISGTIAQDTKYPFVGDVVSTRVSGLTQANRVRWRVVSAPVTSGVKLWVDDEKPEAWLDPAPQNGCRFAPDEAGVYELEAVEEECTSFIPHFDGDGSTTQHPVEEWVEVTTETLTVYVGQPVRRTLGVGVHTAVLNAWVHARTAVPTGGALTYRGSRNHAMIVSKPSSDAASFALATTEIKAELARNGAKGYAGAEDLISIAPVSSMTQADYTAIAFNTHCGLTTNGSHGTADVTNGMGAVALPTDDASFIAYMNTWRTKYLAHIATAGTTHPAGADVTNACSAAAATFAGALVLFASIIGKYELHRVLHTASGHNTPGDGVAASRMPHYTLGSVSNPTAPTSFNSTVLAYLVLCVAAYDNHLSETGSGAGYHAAADTHNTIDAKTPTDLAEFIEYVNNLASNISAHTQNINVLTNEPPVAVYHTVKDRGGNLSSVPRARDWQSACSLLEKTMQIFARHIDTGGAWHGGSSDNPGVTYVQMFGVSLINKLFMDAVHAEDLGAPENTIAAVPELLTHGGFGKA